MNPTIHPCPDVQSLASEIARRTLEILQPNQTLASIALTGGRTASAIYQSICEQALDIPVRWRNVHFFWGDERCVPLNDPQSNYKLAENSLLKPLRIHPSNIHRILTQHPPEEAATRATEEYEQFLKTSQSTGLRLILLSMGEDGHIASLFPEAVEASLERQSAYSPIVGPKPPPERVTLNLRELTQAETVLIALNGSDKKEAFEKSLSSQTTPLGKLLKLRADEKRPSALFTCF